MGLNKGDEGIEASTSDQNATVPNAPKFKKSGQPTVTDEGEEEAPSDDTEATE